MAPNLNLNLNFPLDDLWAVLAVFGLSALAIILRNWRRTRQGDVEAIQQGAGMAAPGTTLGTAVNAGRHAVRVLLSAAINAITASLRPIDNTGAANVAIGPARAAPLPVTVNNARAVSVALAAPLPPVHNAGAANVALDQNAIVGGTTLNPLHGVGDESRLTLSAVDTGAVHRNVVAVADAGAPEDIRTVDTLTDKAGAVEISGAV